MSQEFNYEGLDLDAMDGAVNYHRWILEHFSPYLSDGVVEVGAGIGSFSELIAELDAVDRLLLIEPANEMAPRLRQNASAIEGARATVVAGMLSDAEPEVRDFSPQAFIYVNVFEHVEHDVAEMQRVFELLRPGGAICIFVPALPFLYSKFDRSIDHFRRYTKRGLVRTLREVGFEIEVARYFDIAGILPWLIKFKLLGSTNLGSGSVGTYDKWVVPLMRRIENTVAPPVGKNVLVVARKPR